MSNLLGIKNAILHLILIFFCLPLAFPNFETVFIFIQFAFLLPIYLFLSSLSTNMYCFALILLYFLVLFLVFFGMPGSIIGWMSMVCMGYLVGAKVVKENERFLLAIKPFILLSIALSLWVCFKNYQTVFSHELLSDYFQASSINTIPILLVCSANLYSAIYYYMSFLAKDVNNFDFQINRWILVTLCMTAMLAVVVFDFRSGLGVFVLSILVGWSIIGSRYRYVKYSLVFLVVGVSIIFIGDDIYAFFFELIVPGRDNIFSVLKEVSKGEVRYDRLVNFWEIAGFSKINFASWSQHFSYSGMSDLVAGLFPISLVFFVPVISLPKLLGCLNSSRRLPAMIVLVSLFSSFLISMLQPDFYSMFTFFAIISLVYFGERSKNRMGQLKVSKAPLLNN